MIMQVPISGGEVQQGHQPGHLGAAAGLCAGAPRPFWCCNIAAETASLFCSGNTRPSCHDVVGHCSDGGGCVGLAKAWPTTCNCEIYHCCSGISSSCGSAAAPRICSVEYRNPCEHSDTGCRALESSHEGAVAMAVAVTVVLSQLLHPCRRSGLISQTLRTAGVPGHIFSMTL